MVPAGYIVFYVCSQNVHKNTTVHFCASVIRGGSRIYHRRKPRRGGCQLLTPLCFRKICMLKVETKELGTLKGEGALAGCAL